jgi:hypothetical protein
LQNCVRRWRSCLHTVVDVANLSGVTSDECIERKIDSLRFIASRIRRGEYELARKNVRNVRPITRMARFIPVSWYQIGFVGAAFSE